MNPALAWLPEPVIALPLGLAVGFLLAWLVQARRLQAERERRLRLEVEIDSRNAAVERERDHLDALQEQLRDRFAALSSEALERNSQAFLQLAEQNLAQFQGRAEHRLREREQAVEGLVKPIRETLERTRSQIETLEAHRRESQGALDEHLRRIARDSENLQRETRQLVQALRRPEVRGQWGEMTLKRLAELAGMVEHCDFQEQPTADGGRLRPDMIVRLPGARSIVVDAKTPLDAYLSAVEARDDAERDRHLGRHLQNLRGRVRELAAKAYWEQFSESPDFVVLFIPGDQFLSAALEQDPNLIESALGQRVILATPTSLVALLRAVGYGWRQQAVAENAERIRELGEELYRRLGRFTDHLGKLGRSLGTSVDHYNKAVGSLERQVTPAARRFTELGIQPRRPMAEPEPVDKAVREPQTDSETPS